MLDAPPLPLLDLPEPSLLRLVSSGGQTAVSFGDKVLFCFAGEDIGMRNIAVVSLTDAGVWGKDVAAVFGLTPEYVSMLRGRARADGLAGLVRRRGRPPKLSARQVARARGWAADGLTQTEIARRLSVSRPVIGELLARLGPAPQQPALADSQSDASSDEPSDAGGDAATDAAEPGTAPEQTAPEQTAPEQTAAADVVGADVVGADVVVVSPVALRDRGAGARPGSGRARSPAGMAG